MLSGSGSVEFEPETKRKEYVVLYRQLGVTGLSCGMANFCKNVIFKPISYLKDKLFAESWERLYRYEWAPSKIKAMDEHIDAFITELKNNDLYGPASVFTYMNHIVKEYNSKKTLKSSTSELKDWELPYDICYIPKNESNFFDKKNIEFITRFASTNKFNILPWSYVYSYDRQLDDLREKYVKPISTGFAKSYKIIAEAKIRVTSNLSGIEFRSFCKLHLSIFNNLDSVSNIDQIFSNTVFHPTYLLYMNEFMNFTKYYLRQSNVNRDADDFHFPIPTDVKQQQFNPAIKSKSKEIQKTQEKVLKQPSHLLQPGLSKVFHSSSKNKLRNFGDKPKKQ